MLQVLPWLQLPQLSGEPQPLSGVPHSAPTWLQFFGLQIGGAASTGLARNVRNAVATAAHPSRAIVCRTAAS